MENIPYEAKLQMQEFLANEPQWVRSRRVPSMERPRKPMTPRELEKYARAHGFEVAGGNGRHGVHIVSPTGDKRPLPVHGGGKTLSLGVQKTLLDFIHEMSIYSEQKYA